MKVNDIDMLKFVMLNINITIFIYIQDSLSKDKLHIGDGL